MEGKHIDARWFRDLWAFVDISNRIQSGEMPKVDANGTPIESEGAGAEVSYTRADFRTYMTCLHALIFYNENMFSQRSLRKIFKRYDDEINAFFATNKITVTSKDADVKPEHSTPDSTSASPDVSSLDVAPSKC